MTISIAIFLSIVGQLFMAVTYMKELANKPSGLYARVKCATASVLFLSFAFFLAWGLFTQPLKPELVSTVEQPFWPKGNNKLLCSNQAFLLG